MCYNVCVCVHYMCVCICVLEVHVIHTITYLLYVRTYSTYSTYIKHIHCTPTERQADHSPCTHRRLLIHEVRSVSLADGLSVLPVGLLLLLHLTHNVLAIDERLKPTHWIAEK